MIVQFIKKNIFLCLLIFVVFLLAVANYQPSTYLSGWDTLHPEFDFNLNLKRIVFGVWREEQGLGTVAAHSHMSELPRVILLWIFHFFLPLSFLRYAYVFLCLLLGPVGVYFFLEKIILKSQIKHVRQTAAFLGSLFYLLNFGTVQNFYVPFEMFPTQFAFIGWILLFAFQFLEEGGKKNLLLFSTFVIFSSPMAYASQLWYAFFLFFLILIFGYSIKKGSPYIKKSILLTLLLIILNSFWLLPNLYYIKNYSTVPQQAKTNRISSEEFFYHNQKSGTVKETALLRNFYYNWVEYNFATNKNEYLMQEWKKHFQDRSTLVLGYACFLVVLGGLIISFIRYKNFSLPLFLAFTLNFFAIASSTFIISDIFKLLRRSSLLSEALRFSFNKFSINLIFLYAICFSIFFTVLLEFLEKKINRRIFLVVVFIITIFISYLLFTYTKPAFLGYLIDPQMKIKIPDEYFQLNQWLKEKQDNGRILKLPINTLFGWLYYGWGYQGAGFNWFNIKQPTLDRDFDRWYPYNEQSYREISYAVYSQNKTLFEKLLSKYNIKYVLLDENVTIPGDESQQKKLFYPEIKQLFNSSENIKLEQKFGQKISLFEYLPNKRKKPVEVLTDYKIVSPPYRWNYVDEAYKQYGDYITYTQRPSPLGNFIYPARNVLTEQEKINQKILSIGQNSYQISFEKSQSLENGEIKIPSLANTEFEFYSEVYAKKIDDQLTIENKYLLPYLVTGDVYTHQMSFKDEGQNLFSINDKVFTLPFSLTENPIFLGEEILYTQKENTLRFYNDKPVQQTLTSLTKLSPYLCSPAKENQVFGAEPTPEGLIIYGQKAKVCLEIPLNEIANIEKSGALKLYFDYKLEGKTQADFCLLDKQKNKCLLQQKLKPTVLVNPYFDDYFRYEKEKLNSHYLKFLFDLSEENELKTLLIKNIHLTAYEEKGGKTFFVEIPKFDLNTSSFTIKGIFPHQSTLINPESIGQEKKDCGFEKAKVIDKKFIEDGTNIILEYKAIDGSICDSVAFPNLSQNMGYILAIESQNIAGLPLKICFENDETKVCSLEDRLSKNKDQNIDYFIIPPYSSSFGYSLLLSNLSIGNVPTINRIKNIRVIPFPYNFFQSIRWESDNQSAVSLYRYIDTEVEKHSHFLYSIKIKQPLPNESILTLDQAYEKNWRAYIVPNFITRFPILCWLSPVFGQEIKDSSSAQGFDRTQHVLVNNWANGWRLRQDFGDPKGKNIVIIFWPQYLEFIGFGLMVLGLLWVLLKFKNVPN